MAWSQHYMLLLYALLFAGVGSFALLSVFFDETAAPLAHANTATEDQCVLGEVAEAADEEVYFVSCNGFF